MLEVRGLNAWYGESHVLHGVDFRVGEREIVTLLGRNGAGKTTILRSIMGLVGRRSGSIGLNGIELMALRPDLVARSGIGYCPEERGIFASLSVTENLLLPPRVKPGGFDLAAIHSMFPNLLERASSPGGRLSGGEQQMLAIARILRTGADLLLLDEPTEGLAPVIVEQIRATMREMQAGGLTVLLVEQNLRFAVAVADRHYVVEDGQVVDEISRAEATSSAARLAQYLGV